jgi:hypothetical protein
MQSVLNRVKPDAAQALKPTPLDLPSHIDILYSDFQSFTAPAIPESVDALAPTTLDSSSAAPAPTFFVDSMLKMDWCVSKIIDAEARNARRASLAADLHARIDAGLTKASAADSDSVACLTSLLLPSAVSEIAKQHRSRTLLFPSGSIIL